MKYLKEYENGECECPFCGVNENCIPLSTSYSKYNKLMPNIIFKYYKCKNCKKSWNETYKRIKIKEAE